MATLVLGATGATGKHAVQQLLNMGQNVKVIVREGSNIPEQWANDDNITIIRAGISEISKKQMADYLTDCHAIVSCLGHNLNLKGIYGKPRKLVTDAVKLSCSAILENRPEKPIKFVLMNTTGNRNKDLDEKISGFEKFIMGIIRALLPPQPDNEQAAEHLRVEIGQNNKHIEWVAVRPDSLTNMDEVSNYELHPSPIRSALTNPGKTSRINVGNFIARLITENELWNKWEGQMPVVYNVER